MPKPQQTVLKNGRTVYFVRKLDFDTVSREIFDEGVYRKHGTELHDGDYIFDIGSNVGLFIVDISQRVKQATVFAFEPIPDLFAAVELNAKASPNLSVTTIQAGVSGASGTAEFRYFHRSSVSSTMRTESSEEFREFSRTMAIDEMRRRGGIAALTANYAPKFILNAIVDAVLRFYQASTLIKCRLVTISETIDKYQVPRIDLLKVDAEGAEFDIIGSIREEHWPLIKQTVIEVHDGPEAARRMESLIKARGFSTALEKAAEGTDYVWLVYGTRAGKRE